LQNRGARQGPAKEEGAPANSAAPPMFTLATGTTFVMFVNPLTFQSAAATTVLPTDCDYIPAMSIVELSIAPRHSESCLSGRGINVKTMRISNMEIDAVFQSGTESMGMPFNAIDASRIAVERRERCPALLKDIETEKVSFVVPGSALIGAYMGELPPVIEEPVVKPVDADGNDVVAVAVQTFVKICVGNVNTSFPSASSVDVSVTCLQKQTNTRCDEHACAMLDVAFALGAVDLWCITDDRYASRGSGSVYRAVPVINTKVLFASISRVREVNADYAMVAVATKGVIQFDDQGVELLERVELASVCGDDSDIDEMVDTGMSLTLSTGVDYDDGVLELTMKVDEENVTQTHPNSTHEQANVALALVGPGVKTSKGYGFSFSVKCSDESRNVDGILNGFINRAPAGGSGMTLKRKAVKMS
jgi:hypothetical protein